MRIILEMEGVAYIGVARDNYIVFQGYSNEYQGGGGSAREKIKNPKYFPSLGAALEELRMYHQGKRLAMAKKPAKDFAALLERVEKINAEWEAFYEHWKLNNERTLKDEM